MNPKLLIAHCLLLLPLSLSAQAVYTEGDYKGKGFLYTSSIEGCFGLIRESAEMEPIQPDAPFPYFIEARVGNLAAGYGPLLLGTTVTGVKGFPKGFNLIQTFSPDEGTNLYYWLPLTFYFVPYLKLEENKPSRIFYLYGEMNKWLCTSHREGETKKKSAGYFEAGIGLFQTTTYVPINLKIGIIAADTLGKRMIPPTLYFSIGVARGKWKLLSKKR